MSDAQATQLIPVEHIEKKIHLARGEKALLDADLAVLYGVTTGRSTAQSNAILAAFRLTSYSN